MGIGAYYYLSVWLSDVRLRKFVHSFTVDCCDSVGYCNSSVVTHAYSYLYERFRYFFISILFNHKVKRCLNGKFFQTTDWKAN